MRKHRGWIALDIDGTIADASHHIPQNVAYFLHSIYEQGWEIMFITGRTLSFAQMALHVFTFPFYLALQNGADILYMPSKNLIARYYLDNEIIIKIEELYQGIAEDFILYTGYENGDFCYFRPKKFSNKLLSHLHKIMPLSKEPWKEVDHFDFDRNEKFALIKCLGEKEEMQKLCNKLQTLPHITTTLIRDPLDHDRIYLNLVTNEMATKGKALLRAIEEMGERGAIIAAGDDLNDVSMLDVADFKIVMENAPLQMREKAHFLAKTSQNHGIIEALKRAIQKC